MVNTFNRKLLIFNMTFYTDKYETIRNNDKNDLLHKNFRQNQLGRLVLVYKNYRIFFSYNFLEIC